MNKKSAILLVLAATAYSKQYDPEVVQYGYAGDCLDERNFNTEFGNVVVGCDENCQDVFTEWKADPNSNRWLRKHENGRTSSL
jgi:hypothetical protein